ncbi:cytochrome c oxidase assembly protein COX19 [Musca domestica]|uniref:Cytochrome c oxidase assembly protein COX19 n=1 Tax=Musca domestica TaxID=7370 RepID=A0ABM3V1V3_MUSDO|nr:cytochrome c oxidase assembly protein COX19 [Musca domestica]
MTSNTFNQSKFIPTAPEKGSFPLDHEGLCKKYYLLYMRCLHQSDDQSAQCRNEAREYLNCRMKNELMEKAEWSKLGFEDKSERQKEATTTTSTPNRTK